MNSDLAFIIYVTFWGAIGWPIEKGLKRTLGSTWTWGLGALLIFIIIIMFIWQDNPLSEDAALGTWLRFVFYPIIILAATICSDCIRYYFLGFLRKDESKR